MAGKKRQIVVVGGGAGGLGLVRRLAARYGNRDHDIILVDRNVSHIWKPLLHEVAAGSLDANLDEVGYGGHAARWNYRFFHGELERIDREQREIVTAPSYDDRGRLITSRHAIRYDYLVLAVGGVSNDFGVNGVREHAMFLEHRGQADEFRQRLLNACLRTNDEQRRGDRHAKVRVAIVGGGATGVELAAELYNAAKALRHYGLEVFDETKLEVTLVEAGPRILPALDPELADTARDELEKLGVAVKVDTQVSSVAEDGIETTQGNRLPAEIVVWAAGVKGPDALPFESDLETTTLNTFVVTPTLQTSKDERIFAIGDCASCLLPGEVRPVPPRAQAAHQMADCVYDNLERLRRGKEPKPFRYRDRGSLVSLSRFSTVGSLMGNLVGGRMAVEGRLARIAYLSLYRLHIIAIHGWRRGLAMILLGHVNRVVRPKLKLH